MVVAAKRTTLLPLRRSRGAGRPRGCSPSCCCWWGRQALVSACACACRYRDGYMCMLHGAACGWQVMEGTGASAVASSTRTCALSAGSRSTPAPSTHPCVHVHCLRVPASERVVDHSGLYGRACGAGAARLAEASGRQV